MNRIDETKLKWKLDETFKADIASGRVGGIGAAVAQDGHLIYNSSFSNEEIGINVSSRTLFRLASTLEDYMKFGSMLLNGGKHEGGRIVGERMVACI